MRQAISLLVLLSILGGCGSPKNDQESASSTAQADTPKVTTRTLRGILYLSPRYRVFRELDTAQAYWVADPDNFVTEDYTRAAYGPEAPVWAEIAGTVAAFDGLGIAADFDSLLTISSVTDLSGKSTVEAPMFRASGNEPFWSITTTPGGGLTLRRPEDLEPLAFKGPKAVGKPAAWIFLGRQHAGSPSTLQLILTQEPCQDTMADKDWTWRAMLIMDRDVLRGCAEVTEPAAADD